MIGYGSNFELPELSSVEVATVFYPGDGSTYKNLSTLLTILGIGTAFIPGLGTAATVAIETGIASSQQALDVSSGRSTTLSTALNALGPIIPGALGGIKNVSLAGRLISGSTEAIEGAANTVRKALDAGMNDLAGDTAETIQNLVGARGAVTRNPFTNSLKQFQNSLLSQGVGAGNEALGIGTAQAVTKNITNIIRGFKAGSAVGGTASELGGTFAKKAEAAGITAAELAELAELLRGVTSAEAKRSLTIDFFREIGKLNELRQLSGELAQEAVAVTSKVKFTDNPKL